MKSRFAAGKPNAFRFRSFTNVKRSFTRSEEQIMKICQKCKPILPEKKPVCPSVLVKRTRPQNLRINHHLIEEEKFGLKPLDEKELERIFSLKEWRKKDDQGRFNVRISQSEIYKKMHELYYLESLKKKVKIMDLVEEKELSLLFKKKECSENNNTFSILNWG